jgi:tetratricopeptide (TPR) repeat protein/transcriptional regulator with XRE-family HTH domain
VTSAPPEHTRRQVPDIDVDLALAGMADGSGGVEVPRLWLRNQRWAAGLTQEELAARSGLGVRTISDLERGARTPYARSLRLVAAALGMNDRATDWLVAWYRAAGNGAALPSQQAANGLHEELPPVPPDGRLGQAGGAPTVMPRQLPAASAYFAGRTAELAILDDWADQVPEANGAVTISVICGMAGVGKTALALRWAHQVVGRFPDGQLYVDLRGYGPGGRPTEPAEVIRSFLGSFGVASGWIPADVDGRAGLYRSVLAGKRVLIVADNARDAAQVRMLLPSAPGCLVLVTSRSPLTGLAAVEGARVLSLDVPTAAEAAELLSARLGCDQVAAHPAAVTELIGVCGRLPLALAVVAARAAASGWPLAALTSGLADARGRLGVLEHGDPAISVEAVFSWSYRQLSTTAARVFRLLGIHPGPEVSALAVASLAGLSSQPALATLRELASVGLIAEPSPGRYTLHDLLRAYAADQAQEHDTDAERRAAAHRMLDHYLHTAAAACRALEPDEETVTPGLPQAGVTPEAITGGDQAVAWFAAEHKVLLAISAQATDPGLAAYAMLLPWTMVRFLGGNGQYDELVGSQQAALACAGRLDDVAGQARAHCHLGGAYTRLGQPGLAYMHLMRAVALSRRLGDQAGEARAHLSLGVLFAYGDRLRDAVSSGLRALRLAETIGDVVLQARACNDVGYHLAMLGDLRNGLSHCQRALGLLRTTSHPRLEGCAWDSIGYIHRQLGDYGQATSSYQRAIRLLGDAGARHEMARSLSALGDTYEAADDTQAARETRQQAMVVLDDLHRPEVSHIFLTGDPGFLSRNER